MQGHPRRRAILGVLCAALLVIVVDNTVLGMALPAIASAFSAGTGTLALVVDAYVVVFGGVLVAAGVLSDRWGRRRVLLVGLAVFGTASAAAALGFSVWWLVAMRVAMGVGGALVLPSTLAILVDVFPPAERARAFAVWFAVSSAALAAGPVLGGLVVTAWSWVGVFLVVVPVAAVAAAGVARFVPESRDPDAGRVDPIGLGTLVLGLSAAVGAVILLGSEATAWALPALLVAVVTIAGFVLRQRHTDAPLVDLALYRVRRFAGGSATVTLVALGTGSLGFVLTQYLQGVVGRDALGAGLTLLPLAVGTVLGSFGGGRAPGRIGARRTIVAGLVALAGGVAVLAVATATGSAAALAVGLLVAGAGVGFAGPGATSTVLAAVPPSRAGMGSALNDTHQQVGVALGIAGLGSVLGVTYRHLLPVAVPPEARGSLAVTLDRVGDGPLADAARAAFGQATGVVLLAVAGCGLAGAVAAWTVLPDDRVVAAASGDPA